MKPGLRSTTSKGDAQNASPSQKKTVSKSQKKGKNATTKENQPNPTMRKNVRRNVVQPLQEINAIVIDEKNVKVQTSSTETTSTTSSRSRRLRKVSANDEKENDDNVVSKEPTKVRNAKKVKVSTSVEQPETVVTHQEQTPDVSNQPNKPDQPKSNVMKITTQKTVVPFNTKTRSTSKITESAFVNTKRGTHRDINKTKSQSVTKATKTTKAGEQITSSSSVTVRRTKNKTTSETVSKLKPTVTETTQFVSTRRNRRGNDKQKAATDDESTTKEPIVSNVTTRKPKAATDDESKTKQPVVTNVTTRSRSTVKKVQEVRTSKRSKSQSTAVDGQGMASNISVLPPKRQRSNSTSVRKINGRDKSTKAKATTDDESKSKSSVTSNVTKRKRKPTADVESKTTEPVKTKTATDDESKTKEPTVTNATPAKVGKVFATRSRSATTGSNTKRLDIIISPPKRQKTNNTSDRKINDKQTKRSDTLVNRSTASDSSDQSTGSVLPIYKRTGNTNNNTVESVFDFESNSQENTLNDDEQTKEVLARLVREKKVSVVRPKGKRKANTSKANHSKNFQQLGSNIKKLEKLTNLTANATTSRSVNVTKLISTSTTKPMTLTHNSPKSSSNKVDLVEAIDINKKSPSDDRNQKPSNDDQDIDDLQFDDIIVEEILDVVNVQPVDAQKPKAFDKTKLKNASTGTPPQSFQNTYPGPGKANTLYQSTPVKNSHGNASPWRCNPDDTKYSGNVFSRYSELEKSPIKSGEITKVTVRAKSPMKKPPTSTATQQQTEKPKSLANDLQTAFGFSDDEEENNECDPQRPSLPGISSSIASSILFKKPEQKFNSRKKSSTVTTTSNKSSTIKNSPKKSSTVTTTSNKSSTMKNSPKKSSTTTTKEVPTSSTFTSFFKIQQPIIASLQDKVQLMKNMKPSASSTLLYEPKSSTQSTISSHFGDANAVAGPSSSKQSKITVRKRKIETTRTKQISETEVTTSYRDNDATSSLFEDTWPEPETKIHRSYSRVPKREFKRPLDNHNIMTDDESECGDTFVQKRTKRTKPKDDKHAEQLRQFEEEKNSEFLDVENFEMIMEKSVSNIE